MLDRRRFMAWGGLAAAGLALPWRLWSAGRDPQAAAASAAAAPDCSAALEVARQQILRYCALLAYPNGAAHAVRALGRSCPLGAGDSFRLLLENSMTERPVGTRMYVEAPIAEEGHRDSLVRTLMDRDCERDLRFEISGRSYTFQDCLDSARMLATYPGRLAIDEHAWTIMVLSRVVSPDQARWTNAFGETVDLQRMIDDTSAAIAADTALIRTVDLSTDDPSRNCPVFGRACGGLHMLEAFAVAIAAGYGTPERQRALAEHIRTTLRRIVYDEKVTASVERQNIQIAGAEAAAAVAYDSRMKFLGHLLELMAFIDRSKIYAFSADERRMLAEAHARLCRVVAGSRDMHYERYREDNFLYESLTTGICHAYCGIIDWKT
jgi:hypothetical protein